MIEFCPLCGKEHVLKEKEKICNIVFKGKRIKYNKKCYYCEETNDCFEDEEQGKYNLASLLDAYHKEA